WARATFTSPPSHAPAGVRPGLPEAQQMTDIRDPETAKAYLADDEDCLRDNGVAGMSEALERLTTTPDCTGTYRLQAARLLAAAGGAGGGGRVFWRGGGGVS